MHSMDELLSDSRRILFWVYHISSTSTRVYAAINIHRHAHHADHHYPSHDYSSCPCVQFFSASLSLFTYGISTLSLVFPVAIYSIHLYFLICLRYFLDILTWNTSISLNHLEETTLSPSSFFDLRCCLILVLGCYPFLIIC